MTTWLYQAQGGPPVQNVLEAILLLAGLGVLLVAFAVLAGGRLAQVLALLGAVCASAALTITLIWI